MKRRACVLLFLLCALPCGAVDRSKLSIYVPPPTGGTPEQRAYFLDAFRMEVFGAGYPSTSAQSDSAFTLRLDISPNEDFDQSKTPDDRENPRWYLGITLVRSADSVEIISIGFMFDTTDYMTDWNLYLLYEVMANAALPDGEDAADAEREPPTWLDRALYLTLEAGGDLGYFLRPETLLTDQGIVAPVALIGLEWRFVSFLSLQLDLRAHILNDSRQYFFAPGAAFSLRGVFCPGRIMLEPHAGAEFALTVLPDFGLTTPWLWAQGGLQFGFGVGSRLGFTLDLSASWGALGSMALPNGRSYGMLRVSILAGCKIGFLELHRPPQKHPR